MHPTTPRHLKPRPSPLGSLSRKKERPAQTMGAGTPGSQSPAPKGEQKAKRLCLRPGVSKLGASKPSRVSDQAKREGDSGNGKDKSKGEGENEGDVGKRGDGKRDGPGLGTEKRDEGKVAHT
ncbi:hypothetical protein CHU98_g6675 [Xylaria longipes]|nr:hypothetical protein CHU98_g6675 [Xylaria longipes]